MVWMPENANLILNPTSGAPGFSVENVFCLPGVPSILKSMLGGLTNSIVGGEPILSLTISLRTVESEIADSLTKVQDDNQDVCLLYTSPSPRDRQKSRMPSSA